MSPCSYKDEDIKLVLKSRVEGLVCGFYVFRVSSPQQEVGRSGLHQLHSLHCFLIHHQMPGAAVIHPGSDKHMILCGLILWEEGWNFLWVQMPQEKSTFLSLESFPGWPVLVTNGSQVQDFIPFHQSPLVISLVFYCVYFSFDSIEVMVDLDCGRNHSHIKKE